MNNIDKLQLNNFSLSFDINKEKELENLRNIFINKFSVDKIVTLPLDDYVVGKQNENSFCNFLENRLKDLGDIHGSTAIKFGIYFGRQGKDNIKKYRFAQKYGNNLEDCFANIKLEIITLIKNGTNKDLQGIKKCKLAPIFRGKILATYFPEEYMNIFSEEHLDYFLTKLNIGNLISLNILEKQRELLLIKNSNEITKNWTNYKFSCFLYTMFGKPIKDQEDIENFEDLSLKEKLNNDTLNYYFEKPIYEGAKEKTEPIISNGGVVYPRDKKNSIKALVKANFQCEIDNAHPSFIRKNGKNYTEPHHLIPMKYQKEFEKSLDVPENIVSLCSNCHNQIHYGKDQDSLIELLYEQRNSVLKKAQIDVTLKELLRMYK